MTLFEKITAREIPADIVYEDACCLAIRDISPVAPVHILVFPKIVISRVAKTTMADRDILGHLLVTAAGIAQTEGIAESGFRLVVNNGTDGGETIPHLHIHLIGGRKLEWPPG